MQALNSWGANKVYVDVTPANFNYAVWIEPTKLSDTAAGGALQPQEFYQAAVATQHLARTLDARSPYPELAFQGLITEEPTGQSVVMKATFRGRLDFEGTPVAVKIYLERLDFDAERQMFRAFPPHPNVLKGVHDYEIPRPCIVFPLATHGSLEAVTEAHALAPALAATYAAQIASALAHLHSHRVVHLDMKAANVILSESVASGAVEALVMDFGLAMKNPTAVARAPVGRARDRKCWSTAACRPTSRRSTSTRSAACCGRCCLETCRGSRSSATSATETTRSGASGSPRTWWEASARRWTWRGRRTCAS